MDGLLLPGRQRRDEPHVVVLKNTQAECAQRVVCRYLRTIRQRNDHALLRCLHRPHSRIEADMLLRQELRRLGLDERLEAALVDRKQILSRELQERVVMRLPGSVSARTCEVNRQPLPERPQRHQHRGLAAALRQ